MDLARVADLDLLVRREVVHDHDVTEPQRFDQVLRDLGDEEVAVDNGLSEQSRLDPPTLVRMMKIMIDSLPFGFKATRRSPVGGQPYLRAYLWQGDCAILGNLR